MLQSTLECLYDQQCLSVISDALNGGSFPPFIVDRTRFRPVNSRTLESIAAELFVEQWHRNISYETYFKACQLNICLYTLSKYLDILYSVTMLLTIYGGLDILLKMFIRWRQNRRVIVNVS